MDTTAQLTALRARRPLVLPTIDCVAGLLGKSVGFLRGVANEAEAGDGAIWINGVGDDGVVPDRGSVSLTSAAAHRPVVNSAVSEVDPFVDASLSSPHRG